MLCEEDSMESSKPHLLISALCENPKLIRESQADVAVGDTACHGISPRTREARLRQMIHVADQTQTPFPRADVFRRFE